MNKEEIEEIKKLLFQDKLTQYGKRKLVHYFEQKEFILSKVINKLKEDIENDYCIEEYEIGECGVTGVIRYPIKSYARELLDFIERDKQCIV